MADIDNNESAPTGDVKAELKNQEAQLRSKYGNIDKRKGNPMLMKKLAGKKQYFDSGDYNMQKEKVKGPAVPNPLAAKNPIPLSKPTQLPPAVRRDSETPPAAMLQQRRGSQSTLAHVSNWKPTAEATCTRHSKQQSICSQCT